MKQCPYCYTSNEDEAIFCQKCGRSLPSAPKRSLNPAAIIAIVSIIIIALILVFFIRSSNSEPPRPSAAINVSHSEAPASTPVLTPAPITPTPTPTPVPTPAAPSIDDIAGCDKRIIVPEEDSWLDSYETKYVKSKYGNCIYLLWGPSKDYDHFDTVEEASAVTELARQGDYSLVIAPGQRIGWCKSALIVKEYYGSQLSSSNNSNSKPGSGQVIHYEYNSLPGGAELGIFNNPLYDFDSSGAFVISIDQYTPLAYSDTAISSACIGDTVDLGDHTATISNIQTHLVLLDTGESLSAHSNGYWYALDSSGLYIAFYVCESPLYVSDSVNVIDYLCGTVEYGTDALVAAFNYPHNNDRYILYYHNSESIYCVERLGGWWVP